MPTFRPTQHALRAALLVDRWDLQHRPPYQTQRLRRRRSCDAGAGLKLRPRGPVGSGRAARAWLLAVGGARRGRWAQCVRALPEPHSCGSPTMAARCSAGLLHTTATGSNDYTNTTDHTPIPRARDARRIRLVWLIRSEARTSVRERVSQGQPDRGSLRAVSLQKPSLRSDEKRCGRWCENRLAGRCLGPV